jgi:hypothetical protein
MEGGTGFFLSIIRQNNGFFGMRQMGGDGFGVINNTMSDGVTKVSIKNAFFLPHFCAVRTAQIFHLQPLEVNLFDLFPALPVATLCHIFILHRRAE